MGGSPGRGDLRRGLWGPGGSRARAAAVGRRALGAQGRAGLGEVGREGLARTERASQVVIKL